MLFDAAYFRSPSPVDLGAELSLERAKAPLERARTRPDNEVRRRGRKNNPTQAQRDEASERKAERWNLMVVRIKEEIDRHHNAAVEISAEFDFPVKRAVDEMTRLPSYKKSRPVNTWNAWVRLKTLDINSRESFQVFYLEQQI